MKKVLSALITLVVVFVFSLIIGWNHYSARGRPTRGNSSYGLHSGKGVRTKG
jgi:hypothetical protein